MSEILSIIDVNNYGIQSMVATGGGGEVNLQSKDVTINQNGTTTITADTGYDGLSDVDVTVSGILDTSDATATDSDILRGKSAYVNGNKVNGKIQVINGNLNIANEGASANSKLVTVYSQTASTVGGGLPYLSATARVFMNVSNNTLATAINLQPEQIKKDEVVLGVTGTYEGTKVVLPNGIGFGTEKSVATNFGWLADVDTSNFTNTSSMFSSCVYMNNVGLFDTSNVIEANSMFYNCGALESVPLFDFSNVTSIAQIFRACAKLKTIPLFNTNKVRLMVNAFNDCPLLSNDSLNNILAMCTNSAVTSNKTLLYIGLSRTQATTCQTLSNWDAFVAAGWSSGYTS